MPMCFYLYSGISKRQFLGIVRTVVAAEALCHESSLQGGEFIILAVLFVRRSTVFQRRRMKNRSFRRDPTLQDRKKSLQQMKNTVQPTTTFLHLSCNCGIKQSKIIMSTGSIP